ncbi:hypothetical protein L873DRAFT_1794739 [Choiromyces venosus 120613-1]|uniref:Uncharacterized protein n=1 Tax=Choiromyces venosus 120613-1 TaxID=1336337 RepID=A0A3N4J4V5_9PEZI|nr:hypothetical protein L873DRAFT_1794739 [Choiromyces venosus 120613-1]
MADSSPSATAAAAAEAVVSESKPLPPPSLYDDLPPAYSASPPPSPPFTRRHPITHRIAYIMHSVDSGLPPTIPYPDSDSDSDVDSEARGGQRRRRRGESIRDSKALFLLRGTTTFDINIPNATTGDQRHQQKSTSASAATTPEPDRPLMRPNFPDMFPPLRHDVTVQCRKTWENQIRYIDLTRCLDWEESFRTGKKVSPVCPRKGVYDDNFVDECLAVLRRVHIAAKESCVWPDEFQIYGRTAALGDVWSHGSVVEVMENIRHEREKACKWTDIGRTDFEECGATLKKLWSVTSVGVDGFRHFESVVSTFPPEVKADCGECTMDWLMDVLLSWDDVDGGPLWQGARHFGKAKSVDIKTHISTIHNAASSCYDWYRVLHLLPDMFEKERHRTLTPKERGFCSNNLVSYRSFSVIYSSGCNNLKMYPAICSLPPLLFSTDIGYCEALLPFVPVYTPLTSPNEDPTFFLLAIAQISTLLCLSPPLQFLILNPSSKSTMKFLTTLLITAFAGTVVVSTHTHQSPKNNLQVRHPGVLPDNNDPESTGLGEQLKGTPAPFTIPKEVPDLLADSCPKKDLGFCGKENSCCPMKGTCCPMGAGCCADAGSGCFPDRDGRTRCCKLDMEKLCSSKNLYPEEYRMLSRRELLRCWELLC